MYKKILTYVEQKQYFAQHEKILVAVSGGVDSMNLLHFLHTYQKKLNLELGIAHVNYGQRLASVEEEAYLRSWAQREGLPIHVSHFSGQFSEEAARDFRYAFFKRLMVEQGYTAVVTAHHADDQAETVMMRLLRGSRLRHLTGIREVRPLGSGQLIRPFLAFAKADLLDIFHFEDISNQSDLYLRNRIRRTYLPLLEQENPNIKQHLQDVSHETTLLFEALSDLTRQDNIEDCFLFQQKTPAVQYFLLQDYLERFADLPLSKKQFICLLDQLRSDRDYHYHLKAGYYVIKQAGHFEIRKETEQITLDDPVLLPYQGEIQFANYDWTWSADTSLSGLPVFSQLPIRLRYRRVGDILDFGHFHKKLRRWFIDEKIPKNERAKAIVGEQEGKIIFVHTESKTYLRKFGKNDIIEGIILIENGGTC